MIYKKIVFFIFVHIFLQQLSASSVRIELQLSGGIGLPFFNSVYKSVYSPEIELAQTINTISNQTLNLKTKKHFTPSLNFNLIFFSNSALGLKISKFHSSIKGKNTPVQISLNYICRQPPTYEPREIFIENELDWPESFGKIKSLYFTLLYFFRWNSIKNLEWRFYIGPTFNSAQIQAGYLCYSRYFLGGHSVLFSDQYKLQLISDHFISTGLNSGWQFLWPISAKLSIFIQTDIQLFFNKNLELKIFPTALLNGYPQNLSSSEIDQITSLLNLKKLSFKGSYFALNTGLTYKF